MTLTRRISMEMFLVLILTGVHFFSGARAGFTGAGGPCSTLGNHLDPASFKFISECSDDTFCSGSNGTCLPRLCRRDEFPFGYDTDARPLPPLCAHGFFCPDEGSGCQPLLSPGGSCQHNRDDQCTPPSNWRELAGPNNSNGSICLRSTCMSASASPNKTCVKDTVTYTDIGRDGIGQTYTISRDNCRTGYFCHDSHLVCVPTKSTGSSCRFDVECSTLYCGTDSRCASLRKPLEVPAWQSAIFIALLLFGTIATCVLLKCVHTRRKRQYQREMREYYMDQLSLRRAIIALHTAAAKARLAEGDSEDEDSFEAIELR